MDRAHNPRREKILDAAVRLLREAGLKKLAQPQIAKEAELAQGHLTYYFPRRSDLVLAVAERAILSLSDLVAQASPGLKARTLDKVLPRISELLSDRDRTRALLGLLVESEESPELVERLREKAQLEGELIASLGGRDRVDPSVAAVHAALWGLAIQHYLGVNHHSHSISTVLRELAQWLGEKQPPATTKGKRRKS